ncbi:unnamed protein product [Caenorhabditis angaria]|uniref:G-protein coupled receptors family 1 profile domain-containing protein n=1 Tax=Caenorhabditis angaria TaxID=860376 RepID=A0A9P1IB58_9PELO|nr:unnamed protein product [Caenorhabditis angaria]
MSNNITKNETIQEICQLNTLIAFYAPYQIVYIINVIISICAIFTGIVFIKTHIWRSTFHQNFKFLLFLYFLAAIMHSILYCVSYILLIERLSNFQYACDINLHQEPYKIVHFMIASCVYSIMFIQCFMVVERVVATIKVTTYESNHKSSFYYFFFTFFCIIVPVSFICWAYEEADYSYPVIHAISPPKGSDNRLNIVYIIGFLTSISALLVLKILKRINKSQESRIEFTLSGRYQALENIYTTKFTTCILVNNMLLAAVYTLATFILRNFEFAKFSDPLYSTVKGIFYLNPLFAFSLPLIASWQLSKIKRERLQKSEKIMALKTKGREGSDAYNQLLNDQWAQHFSKYGNYENLATVAANVKKESEDVASVLSNVIGKWFGLKDIVKDYIAFIGELKNSALDSLIDLQPTVERAKKEFEIFIETMIEHRSISTPNGLHIAELYILSCIFIIVSWVGTLIGFYFAGSVLSVFLLDFGAILMAVIVIPLLAYYWFNGNLSLIKRQFLAATFIFEQGIIFGYINQKHYLDSPYLFLTQAVASFAFPLALDHSSERPKVLGTVLGSTLFAQILAGLCLGHLSLGFLIISILYTALAIALIQFTLGYRQRIDFDDVFVSMHYVFILATFKSIGLCLFGLTSDQYSSQH